MTVFAFFNTYLVGRAIAGCTMIMGVMVLALPVTILVQSFTEDMEKEKNNKNK
jgi:hypothetical protein